MATGFNSTTGAAFLQKMYRPGFIANSIAAKASRIWRLLKKNPNGSGDSYNYFTTVDEVPTGSASFSDAQSMAANNTGTVGSQFSVPWSESNEPVRVSAKVIQQTRNNNAAWTSAIKFAMDSGLRIAAHRLSVALYTQGWGELGQLASVSSATFKFARASDIYRVFKGQQLVYSSSLNAAALRSATAQTITAVDYNTNVVTMSGNLSVPGGVNTDWVFTKGDREDAASPTRLRPAGFDAYFPAQPVTDATISTLYGVVRSSNTRLYGNYVDASTTSQQDGLIDGARLCSSIGNAEKLVAVVSPADFSTLSKSMGSNIRYTDVAGKGGLGFRTISVYADGIDVPVLSDKYCSDGTGWLGDPNTFEVASMGPAPHIWQDDGNRMLRIGDDNGVEVRIISWTAFAAVNPAAWCRVLFPSS